ncbi:hypothetical protein C2G38_2246262 [Gigaspora rosea]|uniref:Uncharacterized protein n=1 Tax=Gigaspora rosea TaxID=44941 RepID=A0A397V9S4_9GLOM|nr:hypothetical protein C2G38_2246262 [Gigaspora rosea]
MDHAQLLTAHIPIVGQQLCHPHYCQIIEADRSQRRRKLDKKKIAIQKKKVQELTEPSIDNNNTGCTFSAKIQALTTVLYCQQRKEHANLELDPLKFKTLIETNPQLEGFFDFMTNLIVSKERSAHNINEAKKSTVGLCYLIAGLRNKFVNQHKLEVGLYLMASGATWEAIDTMSSLEYSACAKTCHVFHVYNVDDYHAIHEIRRPDTVSTSSAKHFVTCVAKPVMESPFVPLIVNQTSIHNPSNVEAWRVNWYLINKYSGIFDISYLDHQPHWVSQRQNEFDRVESLTVHIYNDNIIERKEERSIKGLQLVGFNEQSLHSVQDYFNALKLILPCTKWIDQNKKKVIEKFEQTCKDIEYRTIIDLLDNLIPATLDVYAILFRVGSFDEYVETVFRIWTFALRWKRKNYNKAPLIFLSDLFYWKDTDHPFYNTIKTYLPTFNDYYVENTHSRIRANTSPNATADSIINQAYVTMNNDPAFKNAYCKARRYPYNARMLEFLSNKTSLFLIQYFQKIFHNLGRSGPVDDNKTDDERNNEGANKRTKENNSKTNKGENRKQVDLRCLPTAYSTSYPPQPGLCDSCKLPFVNDNEKGNDTFTLEDLVDSDDDAADNNDVEEETDNGFEEIDELLEILTKLTNEIN